PEAHIEPFPNPLLIRDPEVTTDTGFIEMIVDQYLIHVHHLADQQGAERQGNILEWRLQWREPIKRAFGISGGCTDAQRSEMIPDEGFQGGLLRIGTCTTGSYSLVL